MSPWSGSSSGRLTNVGGSFSSICALKYALETSTKLILVRVGECGF